jgi:sec-independent protein translocase protein TatB
MFSSGELILIGLVALIVIGPERLPKVARMAGHLLGRLQRYVGEVKADINREMQLDDLKKLQQQVVDQAKGMEQSVSEQVKSVETSLNDSIAQGIEKGEAPVVAEPNGVPPPLTLGGEPSTPPELTKPDLVADSGIVAGTDKPKA